MNGLRHEPVMSRDGESMGHKWRKDKVPVQYAPVVELVKPVTGISAHNSAKTERIYKRKASVKQLKRACKNIPKASFLSL